MSTKTIMKTLASSLILMLALVFGFGFQAQTISASAQEDEHITFATTIVEGEPGSETQATSKTIGLPYANMIRVRYTVVENTGIDALQLTLAYDTTAFTLDHVVTLDTTALGAATVNGANIVFENANVNGAAYHAGQGGIDDINDALIEAYFIVKNDAATAKAYTFGFVDINDGTDFSNAWKIEKSTEESSTHTQVTIGFAENGATVYILGDLQFTLEGNSKVYNGVQAQDSEITIDTEVEEEYLPEIDLVWFISNGDETYSMLNSNPVNVGTYYVVAEFAQTNYYNAYCGYTDNGDDTYSLTNVEGKVATYTITARDLTITFAARSEEYKSFNASTFAGYMNEEGYMTVDGLLGNDTAQISLNAENILNADVGNYNYATSGNDVILVSVGNHNYTISQVSGTFTITAKRIIVGTDVTFNGNNFAYDGNEHTISISCSQDYANIVSATYSGGENGCAGNGAISVGSYTITATLGLAEGYVGNYVLVDANNEPLNTLTATLTITAVALTQAQVDALVAANATFYAVDNGSEQQLAIENRVGSYGKTYDAQPAYIGVVVGNTAQLSHSVDYSIDGSTPAARIEAVLSNFATYERTNAGVYVVTITFLPGTGYAFEQGVVADYVITLSIARHALTITATGSVQYSDANVAITVDNGTNSWVGSENYATYETSAEALKAYVGSNYASTMNAGDSYTLSWAEGAKASIEAILTNYDVDLAVASDLVVAKKVLNASNYTFVGYTGDYDGVSRTLAVGNADALISPAITSKATVKDVADSDTYTATITLADADNYTFEGGNNEGWTVAEGYASASKQAQVSITAIELTINVAYTKSTATFTLTGFVGEETDAVMTDLAYLADNASTNISGNVYTINGYVANPITVSATSTNTNYTIANATLKNIREVEYRAGDYDIEISGVAPTLPDTELLFDGFKATEPAPVALNHYTFIQFAIANSSDVEDAFDFDQAITENKTVYAIWEEKGKITVELYYMVDGAVISLTEISSLQFYVDEPITYSGKLPELAGKDWFRVEKWFTDTELTTQFVDGATLAENTYLYANYKFNIGLGDVNANGSVDANDITLYRQWIVGGYEMTEVDSGDEWETVNSEEFDAQNIYFVKRVADSNASTAESTTLGDAHLDIRDVSTIRMAMVGGYGFSIVEGKYVDGEELIVTRTVSINNASDLLIMAKSGLAVQLAGDITEANFVGAISNCAKDVVIDLNNHSLTLKSLSIALSASNTGKIEIKNGNIYVADGNGISLIAQNGSVILDNVTLYDQNGVIQLQAADHSLHFANAVAFLKGDIVDPTPAAVKIENGTHVVVEETAEVTIEKIVVTDDFVASDEEGVEISISMESASTPAIPVEGKSTNEITNLDELVVAAARGGEYTLAADLSYNGTVSFTEDTILNLNGHTLRSVNAVALEATQGATLTINEVANGTGAVVAQEFCVLATYTSKVVINGGTFTAYDNAVLGTNGTVKVNDDRGHNTITINGGVFNGGIQSASYVACGIYVANSDTVVVNGGEFNITNGVGILARSGDTTIGEDVIFNVSGDGTLGKVGDAAVTVPAGEVIVWDLVANYPGGVPTLINNSTYDVYALVESLTELNTVNGVASSIKLYGDITTNKDAAIQFTTDTVLYLNNHQIQSTNDVALRVIGDVKLTIEGNGNVVAQEACVMAFDGAEIEINGGTFTSYDNFVVGTNGTAGRGNNTITINGGIFNGGIVTAGYVACGIYVANDDTVVVNGGTFNITNGVGILARSGETTIGEDVIFNVSGDGTLGKVGDAAVTVPAGEVIVWDLVANYPGGVPTLTNNSTYDVYALVENLSELQAVNGVASSIKLYGDITTNKDAAIQFITDTVLYLNNHQIQSTNDVALRVIGDAKLTIEGNGNVVAQEACVMAFDGAEIEINGGTFTSIDNFVVGTNGSANRGNNNITINGGVFNGGIVTAGYVACGIYVANDDTVVVNGGTFNITNGVGILARSGNTTINADVVFSVTGNAVGKVGDSRVVVPAGQALVLDLEANYPGGEPTISNNSEYAVITIIETIDNLAELKIFRDAVNAGDNFAGKTIVLNADITLDEAWTAISNYSRKDTANQAKWFAGTFDGKNHTISGLTNNGAISNINVWAKECTYGLFGSVNNAVIKNLTLTNVNITGNGDSLGALVGYYYGTETKTNISNITISGGIAGLDNVGGVVGRASGSYFKAVNVTVSGTITANYKASGIVGTGNAQEMVFENCVNNANISSTVLDSNQGYNTVAGISITWKDACQKVVMTDCANNGILSTVNSNSFKGELAVDYSPQTQLNQNGTWLYANGAWTLQ